MKRFKGFTLTELIVALAVIGVLVAVVTPAIMKTRPNKNKMMVKKTFYTTEQIVSSLINDDRLYPDMTDFCGASPASGADDTTTYCAFGLDYVAPANFEGYSYSDAYKFAALFKEHLNVKTNDEESKEETDETGVEAAEEDCFYPIFYTSDGVKWDLTGTKGAWTARNAANARVGTFDSQDDNSTGVGTISIDVNGDEGPDAVCNDDNEDCDTYEIQILANGKLRINPDHTRAVNYATINTSIKDSL